MDHPSARFAAPIGALLTALLASLPAQSSADALVTIADLEADVGFLASDELEGRAVGSRGNDVAARFVAQQFMRIGLRRVCDDGASWFQQFRSPAPGAEGEVPTRNVLGLLDGTDAELRREVIVVGAHYDHVGLGRFGSRGGKTADDEIHNGADDNASGTAGILALARALAAAPLRRSVLFIAFSAEELGLVGSRHYVRNPVLPLADTVAMLNFDMIGRSEDGYLFLGGIGTSPAWPALVERHVESSGLTVERGDGGQAPSDSTSFYSAGIPVLFFFTNVHVDYHRATDHAELLEYATQRRILLAAHALLRELGDQDQRIGFTKNDGADMPKDFMRRLMTPARALEMGRDARRRDRERGRDPSQGRDRTQDRDR